MNNFFQVEVKNSNFGEEVVIPANETSFDTRNQPKNAYKTVYLSGEDVSIGPAHTEKKFGSRGSNSSSYHVSRRSDTQFTNFLPVKYNFYCCCALLSFFELFFPKNSEFSGPD